MTELIVHIGSHKTGTTSIQGACRRYLSGGKTPGAAYVDVRQKNTRVVRIEGELDDFDVHVDMAQADRLLRPRADLTITSDESFFWIWRPEHIQEFAALLRPRFDRVRIFAYLRRQDLMAVSHRKQVLMGQPASRFYGVTATPLPEYTPRLQRYFDFSTKLADHWGQAFGLENMEVCLYDRAVLKDGDAVADFFGRAGIDPVLEPQAEQNTALGRDQILVGLKLMELGVPRQRRTKILSKLSDGGRFLPSRQEARDFLEHFSESNRRLETLFRINGKPFRFDESFEMYPETNPSDWSNESVCTLLDGVLRTVRQPTRAKRGS